MTISTVFSGSLLDAKRAFPMLDSFINWRTSNCPPDSSAALVVPDDELPRELGADAETLLLVLPSDVEPLLDDLAESPLTVHNRQSDDLLSSATFLALQSADISVETDARRLKGFPDACELGRFFVCLVAAQRFVLVQHETDAEAMDGFLADLQAAFCSSGVNYWPERYWSEEQLDAAARGDPALEPISPEPARRIECKVLSAT